MNGWLKDATDRVRKVNVDNGWFEREREILTGHMLIVTEVAEASEAARMWGTRDMTYDLGNHMSGCLYSPSNTVQGIQCTCLVAHKPEGVGSEYADVLIRLVDQCDRDGIDLEAEFERKLAYNATRGHWHGGKHV